MPWISSFEDVIEDKGDYVAHQFFLRNPDLPPTKFTIGRLIDYVMKTLFARNPEWNEVPRKWTITIVLDDIPKELQNPSQASDPESLFPTSLLERQLLSLEKKDGSYMLKAKAGPASLALERTPKPTSSGETTRAVITIVRQREQFARTILVERRKLLDRETQPWIPTNALDMSSLSADALVAETNVRAGGTGQQSAVHAAGTPLERNIQATDSNQLDGNGDATTGPKRKHGFSVSQAKRQRLNTARRAPPTTPISTTNSSNANGSEFPSPTNDGAENATPSEASLMAQLLARIQAETAELATLVVERQEILDEVNTRSRELVRDVKKYRELEENFRTHIGNYGTINAEILSEEEENAESLGQRVPRLSAFMARIASVAELLPSFR
ncbi:hypothetical protein XANCAGTX0491_005585 [Xanthoria calcicola]